MVRPRHAPRAGQPSVGFEARANLGTAPPPFFLCGLALAGVLPLLFPEYTTTAMPWTSGGLILLCIYQAAFKIRFPSLGFWFIAFFCPLNLALPAIAPIMDVPLLAEPRAVSIFLFFNISGLALFLLSYSQTLRPRRPLFPTRGPYLDRPAAERLSAAGLLIGGGVLALVVFYAGGISNTFTLSKFELKLIQEGHALNLSLPFFGVAVCLSLGAALGRSNRWLLFASFTFLVLTTSVLFVAYRTRHLPVELITSFMLGLLIIGPLLTKVPSPRALRPRRRQTRQTAIALVCLVGIGILALAQMGQH